MKSSIHYFPNKENFSLSPKFIQNPLCTSASSPYKISRFPPSVATPLIVKKNQQPHLVQDKKMIKSIQYMDRSFVRYPQEQEINYSSNKCVQGDLLGQNVTDLKMIKDFLLSSSKKQKEGEQRKESLSNLQELSSDNFQQGNVASQTAHNYKDLISQKENQNWQLGDNEEDSFQNYMNTKNAAIMHKGGKENQYKYQTDNLETNVKGRSKSNAKSKSKPNYFLKQIKTLLCPSEYFSRIQIKQNSVINSQYDQNQDLQNQQDISSSKFEKPQQLARKKSRLESLNEEELFHTSNGEQLKKNKFSFYQPIQPLSPQDKIERDKQLKIKAIMQQCPQDLHLKASVNFNVFGDAHLSCSRRKRQSNIFKNPSMPSSYETADIGDNNQCNPILQRRAQDQIDFLSKYVNQNQVLNHSENQNKEENNLTKNKDENNQTNAHYSHHHEIATETVYKKLQSENKIKNVPLNGCLYSSKDQRIEKLLGSDTNPLQQIIKNQDMVNIKNTSNKLPVINQGKTRSKSFNFSKSPLL